MPTTDSQIDHWKHCFALAPRDPAVFGKRPACRRLFVTSVFEAITNHLANYSGDDETPAVDPLLVTDAVQLWLLQTGKVRSQASSGIALLNPDWRPVRSLFEMMSRNLVAFIASELRPHANERVLFSLVRALRMDRRDFLTMVSAIPGLHVCEDGRSFQNDVYHFVSEEISKERRAMRDRVGTPKCVRLVVFVALTYNHIIMPGTKKHLLYLITQLLEENPRDYGRDPFLDDFVLTRTQELKYEFAHF